MNLPAREKIAKDIADPEQRRYLVEAQIRQGVPLQLRAMREHRGWTQATLAEKLGTTQNAVSRLENPRTGKPSITTLERIAEVFDVALVVKFASFSDFSIRWRAYLTSLYAYLAMGTKRKSHSNEAPSAKLLPSS
jgi:transcriptional regulator with XRE-family HTH domain